MPSHTLLVLTGPTAVGKTDCAIRLASHFNCPILNADSRQIYRDIPIGTAAPTAEEMRSAKHYFVGTLNLTDYYSAARYEEEAINLLHQLFHDHHVCILSGGSMMYIDSVCHGIDNIPTVDEDTRRLLRTRYEQEGLDTLLSELKLLDPAYYDSCDKRNHKRVIHALEICYMTGQPFSSFRSGTKVRRPFHIVKLCLNRPRPELFDRINSRVPAMMNNGLLDEVKKVLPYRHCNALNTVGYKELFHYLDGEWSLDFAIEKIQRNTRVYAKKQLTWFKKDPSVRFVHPDDAVQQAIDLVR